MKATEARPAIAALATPFGKGAVCILRMSGQGVFEIAKKMFTPFPTQPEKLTLGKLKTQYFTDRAMCVYFSSPHSYTGEDIVEFQCHGGVSVAEGVLEECLRQGCRLAEAGEFSKRAFLNGKMSLADAEGVADLINSETKNGIRSSYRLLSGSLGKECEKWRNLLTDTLAELEVALDYPEEDLEETVFEHLRKKLEPVEEATGKMKDSIQKGRMLSRGVDVAIVGRPNAGKSSLLNALLQSNRAIVSDKPGTTRDVVEQSLEFKDTRFNFRDTAGIRDTEDEIEKLGVEKSYDALNEADVVLCVVDVTENVTAEQQRFLELLEQKNCIFVLNKCDLLAKEPSVTERQIAVSAKTGKNVDELKEKIYRLTVEKQISESELILMNLRHAECMARAHENVVLARAADTTLDVVAMYLKEAWTALGEIMGQTASEEIISRVFEKFCVGK